MLLVLLTAANGTSAQSASGIKQESAGQISLPDAAGLYFESHLAIDPRDSRHMIAISRVQWPSGAQGGITGQNAFVSFDGGITWTQSLIADSALRLGGDGLVYITRDGSAFMVVGTAVNGEGKTVVGRSRDGGRTFGDGIVLPYRDRPWMAFDTTRFTGKGLFDGSIYVIGQLDGMVVSRSTDGGRTFTYADHLKHDEGGSDPSVPIAGIPGDMLIMRDGSAVITYASEGAEPRRAGRYGTDTVATGRLDFLVSDDGGRRWLGVRRGPLIHSVRDYRRWQALQAVRSVVETHGDRLGRIYSVWPEYVETLGRYLVQLGHTDDVGKTWKTTIVSDSLMRGTPSNVTVQVNDEGVVAVTWYDRRDDPKGYCWRLYAAISLDGGEHFLANQRLSDAPTCTNALANWLMTTFDQFNTWTEPSHPRPVFALVGFVPVRFPNGGETQGLEADRDGIFHAAWINGETGALQLWHTSFSVDTLARARHPKLAQGKVANPSRRQAPAGLDDVSSYVRFKTREPRIDFRQGTLEVTMQIANVGARPIRYPIKVVVEGPLKGLGLRRLRVANADNRLDGDGAEWEFGSRGGPLLAPDSLTAPRALRFLFDGGMPEKPEDYFTPHLGVYGSRVKE
jgi:hypothetical protein